MARAVKRSAVLAAACVVGFATPITLYAAGSRYFEPITAADAMPAYEILTRVRALALDPIDEPVKRGSYYILHAYDRRGAEVRVVADAHFGDVLSVTPAALVTPGRGPGTVGGARIIHVPAPGEEQAHADPADTPVADDAAPDGPEAPHAAPLRRPLDTMSKRETSPHRRPFASAPPPPPSAEQRPMLSAPSANEGLSPIYPTPRFSHEEAAAKPVAPPPAAAAPIPPAPVEAR